MSKKNLIISITIILVILLGGLLAYYFLISTNSTGENNPINTIKQLFPFGNNNNTSTTTNTTRPVIVDEKPITNYTQKLRKISEAPVAGFGITDVIAGTVVRHIERATGHVYETELFSPVQNRVSNTTIPMVYNAFWPTKNNSVVVEMLGDDGENVSSYTLSIKTGTTTENNVTGSILADKIEDVSMFGDTVFYLQKLSSGSAGFISTVSSNKISQVWDSPIKELNSQFVNKNTIALTTKPNENVLGYLYFIDTTNNQSRKIIGGIKGLSTLVSSNTSSLIYLSLDNGFNLYSYDIKSQTSKLITPSTLPEKCVWSKKDLNIVYCAVPQNYKDVSSLTKWYMGTILFSDDIWKYNLKDNTSSIVSSLTTDSSGEVIDVIKPALSENEQYLLFINKIDNSLWSLDLTK